MLTWVIDGLLICALVLLLCEARRFHVMTDKLRRQVKQLEQVIDNEMGDIDDCK